MDARADPAGRRDGHARRDRRDRAGRARRRGRRRAAAGLRPRRRARGLLGVVPARARCRAASSRCSRGWACRRWRRRWSGWVSSPPRPSPVMFSCPSGWARASGWRCWTGGVGVAGLAHVVLPASGGNAPAGSWKFADHRRARADRPRGRRGRARGRCWRPCWSAVRACSPCRRPRSRSGSATRPPCASSSPRTRINVIAAETGGDSRAHDPRPRRLQPASPCARRAAWRPTLVPGLAGARA